VYLRTSPRVDPIAVAGAGLTVVGVAVTLQPIEIPAPFATALLALGVALVLFAGLGSLRNKIVLGIVHRTPSSTRERRQLVAQDCWQMSTAVARFLAEHDRAAPRSLWSRSRGRSATADYERDAVARYAVELRDVALEVFDAAVSCGGALPHARGLIEGRSLDQIRLIPQIFADAAQRLYRL
jgi:hypothetical protein